MCPSVFYTNVISPTEISQGHIRAPGRSSERLVGRAGPVFAAQVAYLVTLFGIFWSVWLLDEAYSKYVWLALSCMLLGIFLVLPRYKKKSTEPAELADIEL